MAKGDTTKAREVLLSKVSKYEEPYQYLLLNQNKGESMRAIAKKFGVDHNGFSRFCKKQESPQESPPINNAIEGIKNGLEIIKDLQESPRQRDNQLAQKAIATLEDYYPQMKSIFASIQNRVLNALDRETQKMEQMGEMDLRGIAQTQAVLKMVNDTNYFNQKAPVVAVQNNINNQNANIQGASRSASGMSVSDPQNELKIKVNVQRAKSKYADEEIEEIEGEIL